MKAIDEVIEGQLWSARQTLQRPFAIVDGKPGEPAEVNCALLQKIDDAVEPVGIKLRQQHAAFTEGWTAPCGKQWHERHPVIYAGLAAAGGSLFTGLIAYILG